MQAICSVCHRSSLTAAGLIRADRPADNRYTGFPELPPAVPRDLQQ